MRKQWFYVIIVMGILLSACGRGIRKKEETTIWDKLRITSGIKMDFAKEWGGGYKYVDNCAEILNRFCMLGELEFTAVEEEFGAEWVYRITFAPYDLFGPEMPEYEVLISSYRISINGQTYVQDEQSVDILAWAADKYHRCLAGVPVFYGDNVRDDWEEYLLEKYGTSAETEEE